MNLLQTLPLISYILKLFYLVWIIYYHNIKICSSIHVISNINFFNTIIPANTKSTVVYFIPSSIFVLKTGSY